MAPRQRQPFGCPTGVSSRRPWGWTEQRAVSTPMVFVFHYALMGLGDNEYYRLLLLKIQYISCISNYGSNQLQYRTYSQYYYLLRFQK